MIKKYLSIACVCALLIGLAGVVADTEVYQVPQEEPQTESYVPTTVEKYEEALSGGADLRFWYDDASYDTYFLNMAAEYYEETGVLVELTYVDTMDYVGAIYDATMKEEMFPDAYLLSGEELEKAHLYGVAGENKSESLYSGIVANNAIIASKCHDKMFGYPLSYNVCLLAYNNQYFEAAPESLQAIIDYSDDNEPDENVQYLLEWDAYDPFFGFLFVSESVVLNADEIGVLEATYDEARLEESLLFLEESLASFSLPLDTVTEESVINDVLNGVTLCAIVDSDSMTELYDTSYDIVEFPRLNEELDAQSAALTDMIIVNDYSEKQQAASAFAKYITLENYEKVWEMTGHYPVQLQPGGDEKERAAYRAYEKSIPAPNSQDAGGFWIHIKELITEVIKEQL
ncbi:MAG: extracellular solute-binding protein [Roseburia sp.]|nr:extracellular solute-binding protein [Roseburia sp.]